MAQALSLLWLDIQLKLKRGMASRANFAVHLLGALFFSFVLATIQFFVYSKVDGFPNWSPGQLLLFQAGLVLWTGVTDFLFGGVRQLIDLEVQHGHFDRFFLLPAHPLVSLLTRGTNVYALASVLAGFVGVVATSIHLGLSPKPLSVVLALAFFLAGLLLYLALVVVYCACMLFWVKMDRLREVLDRLVFFGSFPTDLYFGSSKVALLACFPIALWVHLPVQALLGRATWPALGAVLTSVVSFGLAVRFWQRQERSYASAGG